MERPPVLAPLRDWYVANKATHLVPHLEADDLLGLHQTENTVIVSIDKDLLTVPGWHYNHVKNILQYVDPFDGLYRFYYQLLIGDPADNIKGAKGIGHAKATRILQDCTTEEELFDAVCDYFTCWEELDMNAKLVWIQRKGREDWNDTGIGKGKRQIFAEFCSGSDPEDI